MAGKPKIYFGHPICFYNTPLESRLCFAIAEHFPQFAVENPNQPRYQEGYQRWKKEKGNGMRFYFEEVLPGMAAGIFLPFPEDSMLGAGVWGEAEFLHKSAKPIYEIDLEGEIKELILNPNRMLSVEQTRARVYGLDGKTILTRA